MYAFVFNCSVPIVCIVTTAVYLLVLFIKLYYCQNIVEFTHDAKNNIVRTEVKVKLSGKDFITCLLWPVLILYWLLVKSIYIMLYLICPIIWIPMKGDYRDSKLNHFFNRL